MIPLPAEVKVWLHFKSLRSCKFSDPENEVDLVLSRAGIFETSKDIDDFINCPTHKSNLGVGWSRGFNSR